MRVNIKLRSWLRQSLVVAALYRVHHGSSRQRVLKALVDVTHAHIVSAGRREVFLQRRRRTHDDDDGADEEGAEDEEAENGGRDGATAHRIVGRRRRDDIHQHRKRARVVKVEI